MAVKIAAVTPGTPAQRAGICAGMTLVSINRAPIRDVLDYRFYMTNSRLRLVLQDEAGHQRVLRIRKDEYEDLGLEFSTYLMDRQQTCKNKCIFCFVDQMPKGMRESLYFKDDDSRMSFLFGNYITMTNLTDEDIRRIIQMHISPINVSVHTTNPQLRVRMMKNPQAAASLDYLRQLTQAGIKVNAQLVLCPGINDGPELERSLRDLAALGPNLESVACVPVGLTKFREGLEPLVPYDENTARRVIEDIHRFSGAYFEEHGRRMAYPSDEFFLLASLPIPDGEYYGDYDQLENGVGLLALLREELISALRLSDAPQGLHREISLATGKAAGDWMKMLVGLVRERFPGLVCHVYSIENHFFGERITVAGLLTAQDLLGQLRGKPLGQELLLPGVMLRQDEDVFLDDMSLEEFRRQLGVGVRPVGNDGFELLSALLGHS